MIGVTSYGAYIPRLRLSRAAAYQAMGWFAPAIIAAAQGEKAFGNWDEDSLTMAVAAARDCLTGCDRNLVDSVLLASTTLPFADRLNAGVLKTALNLKDDLEALDATACLRAGTSALRQALTAVKAGGRRRALVAAADMRKTRPAYFYEMWFGDGAASLLVGEGDEVIAEYLGGYTVTRDFVDHYRAAGRTHDYMWEERWVRDMGYSRIIPEAVNGLLERMSLSMSDVDRLVFPCFFQAEHRKIAQKLGAAPEAVMGNLHEEMGEAGAAHPLIMFVKALQEASPGDRVLVAGFGQGCDALLFRVTDAISDLPPRVGVTGSLARKKATDNYLKYLKFRGLIDPEMGIRAEAPTQTAMTALYRRRDMVLGLVGGRCAECGTPQFPRAEVCVNPECKAFHSQAPHEFADQKAVVKSYTGDWLSVSVDPPNIYGMIQFEGGGRMMADFTDCELTDVGVGRAVTMQFRKRYTDEQRGFHGYFWKAAPLPAEEAALEETVRFDGRVAVVTGAGGGLGRVYALELARRGAKVLVNDLGGGPDGEGESTAPADRVVDEIRAAGGEAVANHDSAADADGGRRIIDAAVAAFGRVDVLINNAGILRDKTLAKMTPDLWDPVMDVHLKGAYNVTRPAFIQMREQGYGRIVLTSSAAGLYGNFGQTNYSAAKMGLVGFMNTVKLEGQKHDILINTVAPAAATRLTEGVLPADMADRLQPEFVAPLVLHLCSEENQDSGLVFNAGLGAFNRTAVVTGAGAAIGDGVRPPTVEDIHRHFAEIDSLEAAREHPNATAALMDMMAAFQPEKEASDEAQAEADSVEAVLKRLLKTFRPEAAEGLAVVFDFDVTGPAGGRYAVAVREGACELTEGPAERPDVALTMTDADFMDMMTGGLSPAAAFAGGKLNISGDVMKAQLIERLFQLKE